MNVYCAVAIWAILDSGVYGRVTSVDGVQLAISVMRNALMNFYRDHRRGSTEVLTEVTDLTPAMLLSRDSHRIKTKGAETYGILKFVVASLQHWNSHVPEHERLLLAGEALLSIVQTWRQPKWRIPDSEIQVNHTSNRITAHHLTFKSTHHCTNSHPLPHTNQSTKQISALLNLKTGETQTRP